MMMIFLTLKYHIGAICTRIRRRMNNRIIMTNTNNSDKDKYDNDNNNNNDNSNDSQ